ncbi:MAG: hypothetical protein AAF525_05155 [Pseudomonadota bacterium]
MDAGRQMLGMDAFNLLAPNCSVPVIPVRVTVNSVIPSAYQEVGTL